MFLHLGWSRRLSSCLVSGLFGIALFCSRGLAQGPKANPLPSKAEHQPQAAATASSDSHELTPSDLEAFLDGLVPLQLAREDIAGAVVTVVKDGKVIFAKGYGYSDVAKRTPVSPDSTIFRPGSVGKLITWTAVFQQIEQGKLDINHDVNDYLDFKIPAAYGKPITLKNLMTHTPGFEELGEEIGVPDVKDLRSIGAYLKDRIPARIFPPGTTPAYSNYGATVAGYILERVSGQSFNDYVDEHIFKPLGMTRSTCRQPLPDDLKPLMSNGYKVASEPPQPFEVIQAIPAGSCSATAADMAKFMIAHLQGGRNQGAQILRPETVELMHTRQFSSRDDMNGSAGEFYEETRNGHRIIGHAGDTFQFHTDLHLIPDVGLGFYISYNSLGKGEVSPREWVWHRFLDRYFPYSSPAPEAEGNPKQDAETVVGSYLLTRRGETTLLSLFNPELQAKVSSNEDGSISVDDLKGLNGVPRKFREVGPLLYREENGQQTIAFKRDENGRLVLVLDFPVFVFQRVPWYESKAWQLLIVGGSAVVLLLTLLLWPIGALVRRHYGRALDLPAADWRLRLWVRLACAAVLIFVGGFVFFLSQAFDHPRLASPNYNPLLRLFQFIGWLALIGTVLSALNAVRCWREPRFGTWTRLGNSLIALSCLVVMWFAVTHNLFTLNLLY